MAAKGASVEGIAHRFLDVRGLRMHVAEAGSGEPVLFLHGFPEFWYSWRHQLEHFRPHFHVLAPDLRGYGETERRGPYDVPTLVGDVVGLLDALGIERVHLVGHDWGGALAWVTAIGAPERLRTLAVLNCPHPTIFRRKLWRPRQLLRSWYIFFFQLPWLPERLLAMDDYRALMRMMIRDTQPGTFTREDAKAYLRNWRNGGLAGGINWYRAAARKGFGIPDPAPLIQVPTLLIWGEDDIALGKELTHGTDELVKDLRVHYLPNVSHWVQQEAPETVNRLLEEHFRQSAG